MGGAERRIQRGEEMERETWEKKMDLVSGTCTRLASTPSLSDPALRCGPQSLESVCSKSVDLKAEKC